MRSRVMLISVVTGLVFAACSGEETYENETESWVRDESFGIRLTLDPSTLPPVPGKYQIQVDVSQREDWTGIHSCAGLGGVLQPDLSTQELGDVCTPLTPISAVINYPASVTVEVTDQVVMDGGLVIGVNAAFGDWAGTALIDISEN